MKVTKLKASLERESMATIDEDGSDNPVVFRQARLIGNLNRMNRTLVMTGTCYLGDQAAHSLF
jgi:hypothetical protein